MSLPQYRRSGKFWYVSDGLIWDDLPASFRREDGRPLECSSKLFIYNPQRKTAHVTVRFCHVDRPATSRRLSVRAGKIETLEPSSLPASTACLSCHPGIRPVATKPAWRPQSGHPASPPAWFDKLIPRQARDALSLPKGTTLNTVEGRRWRCGTTTLLAAL